MTQEVERATADRRTVDRLALIVIAVVSLAVTVRFAQHRYLGFDEALHVFESTVQPFAQIADELKMEAHPPLHYFAVRLVTPQSESAIWPRLASIVPGTLTAIFIYYCAIELRLARPLALLASLAFALAPSQINMGASVRAYSLATTLTVLAYLYLLRDLRAPMQASRRARLTFAAACVLAMATEYSAIFVVATALMVVMSWELAGTTLRPTGWAMALAHRRLELTIVALGAIAMIAYRRWADIPAYFHLTEFFPAPGESVVHFAGNGIARALADLLCPLPAPANIATSVGVVVFTATTIALTVRYLGPRSPSRDVARGSVLVIHLLLWIVLLVLAYLGLYPFGGRLRHQFMLFPFLLLSIFLVIDEAYRVLATHIPRALLCVIVAWAILTGFWKGVDVPLEEFTDGPFWPTEVAATRRMLHAGDALYARQFNQVGLYSNLRDWRWVHRTHRGRRYDLFTVERGNERLTVIRDREWVIPSALTAEFVADLKTLIDSNELSGLVVLAVPQGHFDRAGAEMPESERTLARLCDEHGLTLAERVVLNDGVVFRVTGAKTIARTVP